jgi:hypothetical protein
MGSGDTVEQNGRIRGEFLVSVPPDDGERDVRKDTERVPGVAHRERFSVQLGRRLSEALDIRGQVSDELIARVALERVPIERPVREFLEADPLAGR